MKELKFKNNDAMPILGLGTWKSSEGEVYKAVRDAIKIGYRHIDCAWAYENESEIGEALTDAISEGEVNRSELWITSKLWNNLHGQDNVKTGIKKSLKDLQLDYLDLYLIHWPVPLKPDAVFAQKADDFFSLDEKPIADTWKGMEICVEEGLAKHIGVSNFSIPKLKKLAAESNIKPEMNQIELHPLLQQNSMLEYCKSENIHLTAYSPLGSMDRIPAFKADDEINLLENSVIVKIADKNKCSPAQVLIKWAIQRGTSVIPKSANTERIKQNFDAQKINLSEEDMKEIALLDRNYRYISGSFWTFEGSPHTQENLWGL